MAINKINDKAETVAQSKAPEMAFQETLFGITLSDPYRWFEEYSQHNKTGNNEKISKWIDKQNEYTNTYLGSIPVRQILDSMFQSLLNNDTCGSLIPVRLDKDTWRYFHYAKSKGQDFYVLYYKDGINGEDKVALDENSFPEHETLGGISLSHNGRLLAYYVSKDGSDRQSIHILDLDKNQLLPDEIPPVRYGNVTWLLDGSGFYYTRQPEKGVKEDEEHPYRVYLHKLGTKYKDDVGIYGNDLSPDKSCSVVISRDGRHVFFYVADTAQNSIFYKDTNAGSEIKPLIDGLDGQFSILTAGDKMYVYTSHNAPKFKVMTFDINDPNPSKWQEFIPEGKDTLEDFDIIGDKIVTMHLSNASSQIKIRGMDGKVIEEVKLPSLCTVAGHYADREGKEMFFSTSSEVSPQERFRYDLEKMKLEKLGGMDVPFDFKNYEIEQVWYESKDKTMVSMFLVHKKGLKLDGTNPTLLYGYGGFSINMVPEFYCSILPFLQAGGVYAVPNLRGGGEYGEEWHRSGALENKQNVFDDFISAAEYLIQKGYTSSQKLAIEGGSNGGLLVGACVTQRPDLFKAVICEVGVLDMLRYTKVGDSGENWKAEYGDPDDPKAFRYLLKYSPYHNIKDGESYPAVLFVTGDTDTRVHPSHTWKTAAKMQKSNSSGNPILLRTETHAGHGTSKTIKDSAADCADRWAFIFHELEIDESALSKSEIQVVARK